MSSVAIDHEHADDVVNEHAVRAAAGITMVVAAIAFSYAFFDQEYLPLQVASSFLLLEFVARTTFGLNRSPVGVVAHWMTRRYPPDWVSRAPKMFAWYMGVGMALAMTIITNSGVRGVLPRTVCAICLMLMWMESALGLCLGCVIHRQLVKRGWKRHDAHLRCANGVCQLPPRPTNG